MKYELKNEKIKDIQSDIEIIFIVNKNLEHKWIAKEDKEDFEFLGFKAQNEEVLLLGGKRKVYVGVANLDHDEIRTAAALAVRKIMDLNIKNAKVGLYIKDCPVTNTKALIEGFELGKYRFDRYKSEKKETKLKEIIISTEEYSDKNFSEDILKRAIKEAVIISEAVNYVRDLVNTPPDELYPEILAQKAKEVAKESQIECEIYDENYLKEEGMNAFLAVARASRHKPRMIHLSYKPKEAKAKVVFVGKGLTYDSGGLSLKPSEYMVTMKSDKSGACAVIGIIKAASKLKLPVEIHAIAAAAENMIGGDAYKPDDILKAKNGKTIEVRNTDAEGRLVLADALCWAQEKIKPDFIIDLATLTGACVVALGEYTIGVMGHNKELKEKILKASSLSGELAAELPFNKYLSKLIKSSVADVCNIASSRYGGAITAALFLNEFIDKEYKEKWIHLDIAGPAFVEKEWGYNPSGASGAGVRVAIKWLQKEFCSNNHDTKK